MHALRPCAPGSQSIKALGSSRASNAPGLKPACAPSRLRSPHAHRAPTPARALSLAAVPPEALLAGGAVVGELSVGPIEPAWWAASLLLASGERQEASAHPIGWLALLCANNQTKPL